MDMWGKKVDGCEGVHGGKGFGARNAEGEMLLEFAGGMQLVVLNTCFTKSESKNVTYGYGGYKTVVESMWKGLKDCLLEETEAVCSKTKGRARHKRTWWWNKDTELAVKDKRRAYELWKKSGLEVDKGAYMLAKGRSKRVVAKAQGEERQRYCDMLEAEDGKGNVFRVAKQMVGLNKDITASGCVKGVDGRTVVEEEGIMQ